MLGKWLKASFSNKLFKGIHIIEGKVFSDNALLFIPYFLWANRELSKKQVYVSEKQQIYFISCSFFYWGIKIRRKGLTVFWPQYFDKNRSIRLGRRVSKEIATEKPLVEDVLTAATNLKFKAEIDTQSKYPRSPYDAKGLVLIEIHGQRKNVVLKKLAPEVKQAKLNRIQSAKLDSVKKNRKKHKDKTELLKSKIQQRKKK